MQLIRLEMKGFKSFADKTIVKFSPGMTAVIGPNGSGKSNITDAMKWVLGESNVRQLRGNKAEDIIFSGTEKRRPMSSAEVTLVFDNTDHQLDVDVAEVAITRRIYRSGDSEFFINKRSCRLKDIHLLLADTGLGRDSMAIIGQNRIDAILNSKPEERRLIFEDVAGISRFKLNKEDALRRINQTERNMERIDDIKSTLEEQLEPLAAKAETTTQYMALARKKRQYDGALTHHEYKTAGRLLTRFENDQIAYSTEESAIQGELSHMGTDRLRIQGDYDAKQAAIKEHENQYATAQREAERLQGQLRLQEERFHSKKASLADYQQRREDMVAHITGEEQQLQITTHLLEADQEQLIQQETVLTDKRSAYDAVCVAVQEEQERLAAVQADAKQQQQAYQYLVTNRDSMALQIDHWQSEIDRLEERLRTSQQAADQATAEYTAAVSQQQQDEGVFQALQQALDEKKQALRDHDQLQRHIQKLLLEKRRELQKSQNRLDVLHQFQEQHEGFFEGTKAILQSKALWRSGVHGAVGELFTVDATYVEAMDIALGGAVQHVITDTAETASQGIAFLREHKAGRVTFLPLSTVQGKPYTTPALQETGVLGTAVSLIQFDSMYQSIFQYLLGRTLIVDNLDRAIALQKKYNQQLRIVTLQGDQLNPGGSVTGGASKRKRSSLLARKEEVQRLEQTVDTLAETIAQWEAQQRKGDTQKEALQQALRDCESHWDHQRLLLVATTTKVDNCKRQQQQCVDDVGMYEEKLSKAKQEWAQARASHADWVHQLDQWQEQDLSYSLDALQTLQARQQEAYEAFTTVRLEVEQKRLHRQERQQVKGNLETHIAEMRQQLVPMDAAIEELQQYIQVTHPTAIASLTEQIETLDAILTQLGKDRETGYAFMQTLQDQLQSLRSEEEDKQKRLQVLQGRLREVESKVTRYGMDKERAVAAMSELGFTLEEAEQIQLDGTIGDWKVLQSELAVQMEQLGPINPNAVAEYEEAQERFTFLENQYNDLLVAKEQLQAVIQEMDRAMSTQLQDMLVDVGQRFQHVFSQLFGGGTAQIVLTDPDNILTGGIDFFIQPPGKKRQPLTLLSGGERALTVIALLFSFLWYRPAPFCVLDEVDAALDEANVERFSEYLQIVNGETQFIVVSHRKKTMEAAEVLQGVTMVERGVSKLLTVAFDEVKEDLS